MRTKHGIMAAIAAFAATVTAVPLSVYAALPDGYAQLDWVESDGTAYINTGVVPTQTMEFTFKFQPETQQAWKGAFGSYADESSLTTRIIFNDTSSTSFRVYHLCRAGGAGVIFDNVVSGLGQPIEGYFNHSYARLNNVEHSLSAVTGTATSAPMKLGRSAGAGTSRQKIFYFKITEGSTLLRDFVPARRKSDSAIGFYDQANSVFYGNAEASGAFTAGPSLDGKLIVSGEPVAYGIPSPGYGTHDDIGAGDSFDVSCPAAYTNYTTATIWYCTGWTLYDVDDTVISSGAGNSFAYTHPNPAAYRRLEWHWKTDAGATAARTVTVASCDRETGATTLAISAAEAGDGDKALVATWSPGDIGNVATNARETAYVGAVAAADTEKSFTIPAAWRAKSGVVKFFLMTELPPYDVRLKSLRSASDGPYIDTGLVPTTNTDIRVTAYHPGDMAPFGVAGKFFLFCNNPQNTTGNWYGGFFGATANAKWAQIPDRPYEHWLNATGAYVDGCCVAAFDPALLATTTTATLTLFARRVDNSSSIAKQGDCTIYSAQVRESGVLVRDYIPCKKNGVAMMYDRAAKALCPNAGSGSFTAGEEAGVAPEDCGAVESVTAAIVFAPALACAVDASVGEVTVTLTGSHDAGVIYGVAGSSDAGTSLAGWPETNLICKVAADATTATGTVPISWLTGGKRMRFIWRSAMDVPYDYEVDCLHSLGSAWANSMVIPTRQTEISVCGRSAYNVCQFGLTDYFYLFCGQSDGPTFYGFFGNNGQFATYNPSTAFHTLTLGPSGAYLDGVQKATFPSTSYTAMTNELPIFIRRNYSSGDIGKNGECKIRWAKIRESGKLIRDFVPCVTNGVACFYERVYGAYYGSQASVPFEPGETVAHIEEADMLAWSEVTQASLATWDGGGADNSFATAANWEGDVLPDLVNGSTTLTFATGGSEAQVPASGASAFGITFDTANNFALTAASGGTLALGAGGITLANRAVADDTTWRFHDLNLPVMLVVDQTWDLSTVSKQRLRLRADGNLQGSAARTLTVTGSGCLSISSTNDFAGNVVLNGGRIVISSQLRPFGSAADGGEIVIDQSKGAKLDMFSAVIDKPIRITSTSSGNVDKFGAYGTSAITAPIYQTSANPLVVDMGYNAGYGLSTLTLSGGGTFSGPVWLYPENQRLRTLVIEGAPIVHSAPGDIDMAFRFYGPAELHLKNQGNRMGIVLGVNQNCTGNSLHCWTNNVLDTDCDVALIYGGRMDIHGFDQRFGDLTTSGSGRIRSDEPAEIFAHYDINGGTTWGVNAGLDGAVTFRKSGRQPLTINGTNTTTGALIAQNGPLVIGETGCWQSTDVRIGATNSNRHASLQLKRSNSFADPRHTMLTMTASTASTFYTDCGESREPELKLDAGVNAVFKRVILNGRCLAPGTWGGSESSAEHKDATHFSGSGMITVLTGGGFFLIVR